MDEVHDGARPVQMGSFSFCDCSGRTVETKQIFASLATLCTENSIFFLTRGLCDNSV